MCEPLLPIDELKNLKFSISSLAQICGGDKGSYMREVAVSASAGIQRRLDWVIANLEKAGEGQKNLGVEKY